MIKSLLEILAAKRIEAEKKAQAELDKAELDKGAAAVKESVQQVEQVEQVAEIEQAAMHSNPQPLSSSKPTALSTPSASAISPAATQPKQSLAEKLAAMKAKTLAAQEAKIEAAMNGEGASELEGKELLTPEVQDTEDPLSFFKEHSVILVDGKYLTLKELLIEISRLQKLAKLKNKTLLEKLGAYMQKAEELEELVTQQALGPIKSQTEAQTEGTGADKAQKEQKDAEQKEQTEQIEQIDKEPDAEAKEQTLSVEDSALEDSALDFSDTFSVNVPLNERQLMASEYAMQGKSFCLIGPAGTGKTTAQRSVAAALLRQGKLAKTTFKQVGTKDRVQGHSFAAVAFTRRASSNLARAIHKDPYLAEELKHNIMTIHALLEFEPEIFFDELKQKESMRFIPKRTAENMLEITHLAIEEASMVGLDLWEMLYDALPIGVQIIFIGDINQLPPVFGASILNYALVQLPIIELTEVYRQKEGSGILENAHRVLKGLPIEARPDVKIVEGKSPVQVGQEKTSHALAAMFKQWEHEGFYDPDQDMILSPFNKQALGTDNMNKWIAQFLGEKRKAIVYEVIAGFAKHYLAVGDRIMVNKQDGYITKIVGNLEYMGQNPQVPGADLTRFGVRIAGAEHDLDELTDIDATVLGYENFSLEQMAEQNIERKIQCSHIVECLLETGETVILSGAGDFGPQTFSLGYVLTVHKAQGCEFRRLFGILHKDHSVMLFRELLYTLMTRAREDLVLIAKQWVLDKAVKVQRIKGNSLAEKIEYFNSGAVSMTGTVQCIKH